MICLIKLRASSTERRGAGSPFSFRPPIFFASFTTLTIASMVSCGRFAALLIRASPDARPVTAAFSLSSISTFSCVIRISLMSF